MKTKSDIDAIKMVRKIRDKQSKKYYGKREKFLKDLQKLDDQTKEKSRDHA